MPYVLPVDPAFEDPGPWDHFRPSHPSLLIVRRSFTQEQNPDMVWRMTVSYVAIGTVVLYFPDEHDGEEDCGWWKVHILGQGFRHSEAEWLHPGILAKINGRILVKGDDQPHAWPATFDRMSCHKMGEREKPSREELRHTGYCEACIRRMARFPSFIQHLLQAIRLLEKTDGLTLVCKAGLHRSVTIGHLTLALTACESGFTPWRSCSLRCLKCSPSTCAKIILQAEQ